MIEMIPLIDLVNKPISGEWGDGEGKIKVLRTTNFTNEGRLELKSVVERNIDENKVEKKKLLKGDIIIEKSGGSPSQPVGRVVYFEEEGLYLCNNFTSCLRPKAKKVFPKYLHYILFSAHKGGITQAFQNKTTGIINLKLNNYLEDLKIPLPPLPTQKKIAAILDAADAHRQKTKQLLAKYDELAQSIFLEMFGDPVTNPKGWNKVKLGSVTNMKAGKFVPASEIFSNPNGNMYECYGGNGLRGYVNSHTHKGNFVLIGRQGALCGNVKMVSGVFHATEHAIVCSPKKEYETRWLYFLLDFINLNKYATGAAQPGLNVGKLVEIEIVLPPHDLQRQFVESFNLIEMQKVQSQHGLDQSINLFNSLLQKAFSGELVK
jgi:type I restriction enzyme S subunit